MDLMDGWGENGWRGSGGFLVPTLRVGAREAMNLVGVAASYLPISGVNRANFQKSAGPERYLSRWGRTSTERPR